MFSFLIYLNVFPSCFGGWEGIQLKLFLWKDRLQIGIYSAGELGVYSLIFLSSFKTESFGDVTDIVGCVPFSFWQVLQVGDTGAALCLENSSPFFLAEFTHPLGLWIDIIFPGTSPQTVPSWPSIPHPILLVLLTPAFVLNLFCFGISLYCLYSLLLRTWGFVLSPLYLQHLMQNLAFSRCSIKPILNE